MLTYVNAGERQYGLRPILIHARGSWEFEAVLSGAIAPWLDGPRTTSDLHESSLWAFAPGMRHGWTGDGTRSAEVVVFHFATIPEPLASMTDAPVRVPLSPAEASTLRALAVELLPELWNPTLKGQVVVARAAAEVCLIALKTTPNRPLLDGRAREKALVHAAVLWYSEHLADSPTLEDMGRAIGASPSHLRRLFHRVSRKSPRQVMEELRLDRALQLLRNPELTLEAIAESCGYSDASALSRAFKRHQGKPPSAFRP